MSGLLAAGILIAWGVRIFEETGVRTNVSRETHRSFGEGVVDQSGDEGVEEDKRGQQGQQRRPRSEGGQGELP